MITASSSNWLDRLRSSRGFPTGEKPDLDRFLSSSSSGSAPTTDSSTLSESTQWQSAEVLTRLRDAVKPAECGTSTGEFAGVLCDLFYMGGGSSRSFSKKSSRKQANPRFCGTSSGSEVPSSSDDLRIEKSENGGFVSSGDNSLNGKRENETKRGKMYVRVDELRGGDVDVDGEENVDLKAYSRSEVTIIDTSFEEWKSDKWVFRKNDQWKIKEKKCSKGKSSVLKKRRLLEYNTKLKDDDHQLKQKKMKEGDSLLLLNKGLRKDDKEKRLIEEIEDFHGKVPQRRQ